MITLPPGRDVVTYDRISNDDTNRALGVSEQNRKNTERAEDLNPGVSPIRFSDNDLSAFNTNVVRDDYQKMLNHLRKGRTGAVVAWHADRLHRKNEELEEFIRIGQKHELLVVTIASGIFDLSTASGRKQLRNATAEAEYESDHRSERVTQARERAAVSGKWHGGRRSYGWGAPTGLIRRDYDKDGNQINVPVFDYEQHNEEEAEVLMYWGKGVLKGETLHSLVKWSRDNGHRSQEDKVFQGKDIKRLLTSPRVAGHSIYKGEIVVRDAFPPIISESDRQQIIAILTNPNRPSFKGGNAPKYLASMIVTCGRCSESKVTASQQRSGNMSYTCRTYQHLGFLVDQADEMLTELLIGRLFVINEFFREVSSDGSEREEVLAEIEALEAWKNEAAQMFASGTIDAAQFATMNTTFVTRLTELQTKLVTLNPGVTLDGYWGVDVEGMSLDTKRALLREHFQSIELLPSLVKGRPKKLSERERSEWGTEMITRMHELARTGGTDEKLRIRVKVDTSYNTAEGERWTTRIR